MIRHQLARRPRSTAGAAFSLLEVLVVVAIGAIVIVIGTPSLLKALERAKLDAAARQTAQLFHHARLEAIKRAVPARVVQDFSDRTVFAYADLDSNGSFDAAVDRALGQEYRLPTGIEWHGPGDADSDHSNSSVGFAEPAESDGGTATLLPNGTADRKGAFRLSDDGRNHLEVKIENPNTAKVAIQKYFGDPAAELAEADEVRGDNWHEHGEDGFEWTWY